MAVTALSYKEALKEVKAQVAASKTSFHAGMAALPEERRNGMYALYGFCRVVDDLADDSPSPEIAAQGLAVWRQKISALFQGKPSDAVTIALHPAVEAFSLIEKDFQDIIDGMVMDSRAIVAPDRVTLDLYCDRVASAVGRVSVRIFGDSSDPAMQVAHHLGRALQLTNILRDLAEDAVRGRLYLPADLLDKYGIATRDPQEALRHAFMPDLCREVASAARDHYAQADLLMGQCSPHAMRPARIMRLYYGAIFDKVLREGWRDLSKRVRLSKMEKAGLMIRIFWEGL